MSVRRAALLAALLTMAVAAFGVAARSTYGAQTSSDEPQYLLTALSLAEDFDLDISDELDRRAFEPFHEIDLNPQTYDLNEWGQRLSPHDPLLPLVAAPAMWVGGWVGVRVLLVLIGGLVAGLTTWTAVKRFGVRPGPALVGVGAMTAGAPIAAYSTQVFPEILAALCVVGAVAAGTAPHRRAIHAAAVVTAVVALPWLSIKYAPVAAALVVVLGVSWWRDDRRRSVTFSAAALALAGAVYLLVHQRIYGGWTVYATGDHFIESGEFAVVGTDPDYWGRSRRIIGLLADRRYGLVPWAPVWLVAPAAIAWVATRQRSRSLVLIAPIAAGWATATFVALTMHGWWSPGRQVVVIVPLVAIAVAILVDDRPRLRLPAAVLGLLGASNWVWLSLEASTGRRVLIVDFYETAAPAYRLLNPLFAQGWPRTAGADGVLTVWAALAVVSMIITARAARRGASPPTPERQAPLDDGVLSGPTSSTGQVA